MFDYGDGRTATRELAEEDFNRGSNSEVIYPHRLQERLRDTQPLPWGSPPAAPPAQSQTAG